MASRLIRGAAALGLGRYPSTINNPTTRLQQMGNSIGGNNRRTPVPSLPPAPTPAPTPSAVQTPGSGANATPQEPKANQRQAEGQARQSRAAAARNRILSSNPGATNSLAASLLTPIGPASAQTSAQKSAQKSTQTRAATVRQWRAWAEGSNQQSAEQRTAAAREVALCCRTKREELSLKHMHLQGELPPLPQHILKLDVSSNLRPTFPSIPAGLQRLFSGVGRLEQLPALPELQEGSPLENLVVSDQRGLTALPPIPRSLEQLLASNCDLRQLPEMHDAGQLRYLNVSGNPRLEQLPTLPRNLKTLKVSGCHLTALPVMPESLLFADFSNNRISDLSQRGPRSLQSLDLRGNPITDLPEWVLNLGSHAEVQISAGHMSDQVLQAITTRAKAGIGPHITFEEMPSDENPGDAAPARPTSLQERKVQQKAETPTLSKNGFPDVRLNGQVRVKPSDASASYPEAVACRHLAMIFAEHAGKKREMLQTFSTESGITETFAGKLTETEASFEKAIRDAPQGCKHLVNSDQMGGYLKAIASQLQAPHHNEGPSQANCLLLTVGHAMALHVERKNKNGVDYFAAKLFDPNDTANYRRVVKATPQDFANLNLKDMMIRPTLISQYARGRNKLLSMVAVSMDHRLQPDMDRKATNPSFENMHLAMDNGVLDELRSMLKVALNENLTSKESLKLLQANFSQNGIYVPGLYMAHQNGHADAVKVFAQEVLSSKLSHEDKLNLLAAKSGDGTPGLVMALQTGHPGAIQAFAKEVLSSNFSQEEKVNLLAAKKSNGTPGLLMAFQMGHPGAIQAFAKEVLSSNFSQEDKVNLLAAIRSDGTAGLAFAFHQGHSAAVQTFTEEVLSSKLTQEEKVNLLAAKSGDGTAGLVFALEEGQTAAVQVFTKEVLSSKLSQDDKVNLLAAKRSDGTAGLFMAFEEGHSGAIQAFAKEVLSSNLSQDDKVNLLAASKSDGFSGLSMAVHQGHHDAAQVFEQEVSASNLSDAAKSRLLSRS